MTINKSQGQTFAFVGVDLTENILRVLLHLLEWKLKKKDFELSSVECDINSNNLESNDHLNYDKFSSILDTHYLANNHELVDEKSVFYIAGYASFVAGKSMNVCCAELLIKDKGAVVASTYFDYLQRGGLVIPQPEVIYITNHMASILCELFCNSKFNISFNSVANQKNILQYLTMESIELCEQF